MAKLTEVAVRRAGPGKHHDGGGLFLVVSEAGGRSWRLKFQVGGKEKSLTLGRYPDLSLKGAREAAAAARNLLAQGIDPAAQKAARKAAAVAEDTFEAVAREWYTRQAPTWAASHSDRVLRRLERDVFPLMGKRPIAEIDPPEVLACLRRIEARGAGETAHRAKQNIGQVMRYAVATGRRTFDPTRDLDGALAPVKEAHFAAVTNPAGVGELLRVIEGYTGSPLVRGALLLGPHVFVRPGELRHARWADIDLDAGEWRFTTSKTGRQHIVPLSRQAVEILREVQPWSRGSEYVFPSARSPKRPMSDNAVLAAFRRLGIPREQMSGHGWRAAARTLLDEVLKFPVAIIEHQLAHEVRDVHGRAYNRTSFLEERRQMMQSWSDYLDALRDGTANVVALRPGREA